MSLVEKEQDPAIMFRPLILEVNCLVMDCSEVTRGSFHFKSSNFSELLGLIVCWPAWSLTSPLTFSNFLVPITIRCVLSNIRQNFKNTSHGNAIFSGLTNASNLIPICVTQTCPGVQYLFSSIWTQTSRSYRKSAPKLVEQNEGTTHIPTYIVTYVSEVLISRSDIKTGSRKTLQTTRVMQRKYLAF